MNKECRWVWEPRGRGLWARLLFWRRTTVDASGGVWVRKRERGIDALLAADERERGW